MRLRKQNQTAHPLQFLMVQSSDHVTALTGATPTVTLSKDGAAFASPAGAVSEIANGWYKVAGNATDTNTLGALMLHATAASGDPSDTEFQIVAFDPDDAINLGLTALSERSLRRNTAQAGSTSTTIILDAAASAVNNFYSDDLILITGGTGAGQIRTISSYVGSTKVATIIPAWTTTPDNTSTFAILIAGQVDVGLISGSTPTTGSPPMNIGTITVSATNAITNSSDILVGSNTGNKLTLEVAAPSAGNGDVNNIQIGLRTEAAGPITWFTSRAQIRNAKVSDSENTTVKAGDTTKFNLVLVGPAYSYVIGVSHNKADNSSQNIVLTGWIGQ